MSTPDPIRREFIHRLDQARTEVVNAAMVWHRTRADARLKLLVFACDEYGAMLEQLPHA